MSREWILKREEIVHLDIFSWGGYSPSGHYYGSLVDHNIKSYKLFKPISRAYVKELNSLDNMLLYKVGDTTERFPTELSLIKFAVKEYKNIFPKARALILGSPCICDPMRVIDGPKQWKGKINRLVKKFDALNGWDNPDNEKQVEAIWNKWKSAYTSK